jgi:hypothetical protein
MHQRPEPGGARTPLRSADGGQTFTPTTGTRTLPVSDDGGSTGARTRRRRPRQPADPCWSARALQRSQDSGELVRRVLGRPEVRYAHALAAHGPRRRGRRHRRAGSDRQRHDRPGRRQRRDLVRAAHGRAAVAAHLRPARRPAVPRRRTGRRRGGPDGRGPAPRRGRRLRRQRRALPAGRRAAGLGRRDGPAWLPAARRAGGPHRRPRRPPALLVAVEPAGGRRVRRLRPARGGSGRASGARRGERHPRRAAGRRVPAPARGLSDGPGVRAPRRPGEREPPDPRSGAAARRRGRRHPAPAGPGAGRRRGGPGPRGPARHLRLHGTGRRGHRVRARGARDRPGCRRRRPAGGPGRVLGLRPRHALPAAGRPRAART